MATMVFPQINYGQGDGAWSPASSAPVYQKMERARFDAAFALLFCMDILFGKERSGDSVYVWEYVPVFEYDSNEGSQVVVSGYWIKNKVQTEGSKGTGWLYNDNSLNASRSGVPHMFGPPASRSGASWLYAVPCTTTRDVTLPPVFPQLSLPVSMPQFSFVLENALTGNDARYVRLLDAGHVAFAATDHYGTTVAVPYALGWEPVKQRRARPECGNSKASPRGSFYR